MHYLISVLEQEKLDFPEHSMDTLVCAFYLEAHTKIYFTDYMLLSFRFLIFQMKGMLISSVSMFFTASFIVYAL